MVGLGQHGFHQRHGRAHADHRIPATGHRQGDPGRGVVREQADAVAGAGCHGRQQQGGVHRVVKTGGVADATGAGPSGVQDADDPAVPLRPQRSDCQRAVPRAGPPVDHTNVVARDVVAQAVELRALSADTERDVTLDFL